MLFSLGIHIINYIIINFVFYYDSSLILILSSLSMAVLIYYGNKFNIVGITGGIGSGKSLLTNIIKNKYKKKVIECDELARDVIKPDTKLY